MATDPTDAVPSGSRRKRVGCLGCLVKGLGYLLGAMVVGAILVLAITAVFNPWSFYMGGRFHPIPMWRGWGTMRSASGRDYALYVQLQPYYPRTRKSTVYFHVSGPSVVGSATLCTPKGETYNLHVGGSYIDRHIDSNTDGKRMDLGVYRRPWYFTWAGKWDSRPRLEFKGAWHNPDLILDDGGSLDRAFNADGTLRSGPTPQTPGEKGAQLTLHEGDKSEFEAACTRLLGH